MLMTFITSSSHQQVTQLRFSIHGIRRKFSVCSVKKMNHTQKLSGAVSACEQRWREGESMWFLVEVLFWWWVTLKGVCKWNVDAQRPRAQPYLLTSTAPEQTSRSTQSWFNIREVPLSGPRKCGQTRCKMARYIDCMADILNVQKIHVKICVV